MRHASHTKNTYKSTKARPFAYGIGPEGVVLGDKGQVVLFQNLRASAAGLLASSLPFVARAPA